MPPIASASSHPISGFSRLPKLRQSVSAKARRRCTPRCARRRALRAHLRETGRAHCVAGLRGRRRGRGTTASGAGRPRRVPAAVRCATCHELVVLLVNLLKVDDLPVMADRSRSRVAAPLDLVTRAIVGEEGGPDLRLRAFTLVERAAFPVAGKLPISAQWSSQRSITSATPSSASGRTAACAAPGSPETAWSPTAPSRSSRSGTRSRWPLRPRRRVPSRQGQTSPAAPAVLEGLDVPALDELEGLDQPLAGERVADLHGLASSPAMLVELLAGEHARAADPVAPGRRRRGRGRALPVAARASPRLGRQEPDAHRVHEAVARVPAVEDRLAATVGTPTQFP